MSAIRSLPRVSILTANSGGGHRAAAASLAGALDGRAEVSFVNLLDEVAPFPFNRFSSIYGPLVNYAPDVYRLIYRASSSRRRLNVTLRTAYPLVRRQVISAFTAARPDLVISVHPLQTNLPLRALRSAGNRAPFITVVTDPVSPPTIWFSGIVDLCIVATEEARQFGIRSGMPADRMRVIGLPIRNEFSQIRALPKEAVKATLNLPSTAPLVLLTGGGDGIGKLLPTAQAMARRASQTGTAVQLAIITGRNHALYERLRAEPWPIPVTVLGYVENMAAWMAASDLLITKAGPGTLAEAACVALPVIMTGFIPGQEAGNVRWFTSSGAGVFEPDPGRAADLVELWLRPDCTVLKEMAARASAIAHPEATTEIADAALALLPRPPIM